MYQTPKDSDGKLLQSLLDCKHPNELNQFLIILVC